MLSYATFCLCCYVCMPPVLSLLIQPNTYLRVARTACIQPNTYLRVARAACIQPRAELHGTSEIRFIQQSQTH
jgi:hypothetical protein